jgi:hypothetical protein
MFTQECLLRNVGEAKMHVMLELTKRGYSPMYLNFENNVGGNNMVCEMQTWHCTDSDNKPDAIDCGENIDLFLAIASLRDDTDKYQWFTDGNITEMSTEDLPSKYMMIEGHKCTVEELIKIFNK